MTELNSTQRPFFIYGSLRPGCHNYGPFLGSVPHTLEPAILNDFASMYANGNSYPYLVKNSHGGPIQGELVFVDAERYERVLFGLDALEGYNGPGEPNHYEREVVTVKSPRGDIEAYVYVASENVASIVKQDAPPVPSGDWVEYLFSLGLENWKR